MKHVKLDAVMGIYMRNFCNSCMQRRTIEVISKHGMFITVSCHVSYICKSIVNHRTLLHVWLTLKCILTGGGVCAGIVFLIVVSINAVFNYI